MDKERIENAVGADKPRSVPLVRKSFVGEGAAKLGRFAKVINRFDDRIVDFAG